MPFIGGGVPAKASAPTSNVTVRIGGQLDAVSLSSSPHRSSLATPGCQMMWVEMVSLGKEALSTSSTR
jgi:hypothetical protein